MGNTGSIVKKRTLVQKTYKPHGFTIPFWRQILKSFIPLLPFTEYVCVCVCIHTYFYSCLFIIRFIVQIPWRKEYSDYQTHQMVCKESYVIPHMKTKHHQQKKTTKETDNIKATKIQQFLCLLQKLLISGIKLILDT